MISLQTIKKQSKLRADLGENESAAVSSTSDGKISKAEVSSTKAISEAAVLKPDGPQQSARTQGVSIYKVGVSAENEISPEALKSLMQGALSVFLDQHQSFTVANQPSKGAKFRRAAKFAAILVGIGGFFSVAGGFTPLAVGVGLLTGFNFGWMCSSDPVPETSSVALREIAGALRAFDRASSFEKGALGGLFQRWQEHLKGRGELERDAQKELEKRIQIVTGKERPDPSMQKGFKLFKAIADMLLRPVEDPEKLESILRDAFPSWEEKQLRSVLKDWARGAEPYADRTAAPSSLR